MIYPEDGLRLKLVAII